MARAARERAGAMRSDTLKFRPDTARSNVKQLTPRACAQSPMVDTGRGFAGSTCTHPTRSETAPPARVRSKSLRRTAGAA